MTDIFSPTPAKVNNKPAGKRRPKRVGPTLKRIWALVDDPSTPNADKIELMKQAVHLTKISLVNRDH